MVVGGGGWAWRQVSEYGHSADPSWGPGTSTSACSSHSACGVPQTAALGDEDEDEDDGDFVEVPEKEGYEACVPEHLWPEDGEWRRGVAWGLGGGIWAR